MHSALDPIIDGKRGIPLVGLKPTVTQFHSTYAVSRLKGLKVNRRTPRMSVMVMLIEVTPTKPRRQKPLIEYRYGLTEKVDVEYYACPGSS